MPEIEITPEVTAETEAPAYVLPDPLALVDHLVIRPEHRVAGWTVREQLALDPTVPVVQELAYHLLSAGLSAPKAMMGGTGAAQVEDRKAKVSIGGDDRWFASVADVRSAAAAWAKHLGVKPADYPWVVRRPGKGAAA